DAGVTLLDTADAYCWDEHDAGHSERLIAHAIAAWRGDRSRILVATKGGLTRPEGRWVPDGRAGRLRAACEASLRALGVDRIALSQALVRTGRDRGRLATRCGTLQATPRRRETVGATAASATAGEIVMVMGLPGAGKTTAAQALAAQGYVRVSRDDDGGSLRGLVPELGRLVESGHTRIVLDNTYVSRKSRAPVVQAAEKLGLPLR